MVTLLIMDPDMDPQSQEIKNRDTNISFNANPWLWALSAGSLLALGIWLFIA